MAKSTASTVEFALNLPTKSQKALTQLRDGLRVCSGLNLNLNIKNWLVKVNNILPIMNSMQYLMSNGNSILSSLWI
jgi:hypothetical protein